MKARVVDERMLNSVVLLSECGLAAGFQLDIPGGKQSGGDRDRQLYRDVDQ